MYTQCPACYTVFTVHTVQLAVANGQVRCGVCSRVFNGVERLVEELPEDVKMLAAVDAADNPPLFRTKRVVDDADVPPAASVYFPSSNATHPRGGMVGTLLWTAGILVLIVVFVLQYAYFMRNDLVKYEQLRPALDAMCQLLDCRVPPRRDLSQIAIIDRQVIEDPDVSGALLVDATIENNATFTQPFPILQLTLSDMSGRIVARGRYSHHQYLVHAPASDDMPPRTPVKVHLEIIDPNRNATNFEFSFL
jgi:predicted Zn finger-like uncharacterized protein